MKGPSLERQYNIIQERIKERIDNYNSKRLDYNFPDLKRMMIESFQKFDVQECEQEILKMGIMSFLYQQ